MNLRDLWEEYVVHVELPHLPGHKVSMCGLCGNAGRIDTVGKVFDASGTVDCGTVAYCICPNGRKMKRVRDAADRRQAAKQR